MDEASGIRKEETKLVITSVSMNQPKTSSSWNKKVEKYRVVFFFLSLFWLVLKEKSLLRQIYKSLNVTAVLYKKDVKSTLIARKKKLGAQLLNALAYRTKYVFAHDMNTMNHS